MPCVISQWSTNLVSVVFVTTKSDPGQCPFTLDDTFFPIVHGGKRFLDCVWARLLSMVSMPFHFRWRVLPCCPWGEEVPWLCVGEAAVHGAKRPHAREVLYLTRSLCCPWGERKTLRVWVRLLSVGPRVCIPERTISCQLWMGGSLDWSMC